jgi:D-glycero-D-manno-heptose 1,7-bisphosphate phosphatase
MSKKVHKCAFLDRDGVINEDKGYISRIQDFKIFPQTANAIKLLNDNNFLVILITNQAGVGRGFIKLKELRIIHTYLKNKLKKKGAYINDIYFCPFHPLYGLGKYKKNSKDRKPGSGMIIKARKKWNIDIKQSFMIGDKKTDLIAAKNVGLKFFYKSKKKNLYLQIRELIKKPLLINL